MKMILENVGLSLLILIAVYLALSFVTWNINWPCIVDEHERPVSVALRFTYLFLSAISIAPIWAIRGKD